MVFLVIFDDFFVMILLILMDVSEGDDVGFICLVFKFSNFDIFWVWYCGNYRFFSDRVE